MNEVIFLAEEDLEGGYNTLALSESIFTQGDSIEELRGNIREGVDCHYGV